MLQVVEQSHCLELVKAQRLKEIDSMMNAVDNLHKDMSEKRIKKREQAVNSQNRKPGVQAVNDEIGDVVLVARRTSKGGDTFRVNWTGPRHVVWAASHSTFEVQNILTIKSNYNILYR